MGAIMSIVCFLRAEYHPFRSSPSRVLPWLSLLVFSLIACSGDEQPAARSGTTAINNEQATAIESCSLLTADEVSQVVGRPVVSAQPVPTTKPRYISCEYSGTATEYGPLGSGILMVTVEELGPTYRPRADYYRRQEQELREGATELEFLDGLGTAAMWFDNTLHAIVPGYEVIIADAAPAAASTFTKQHARALMQKALARLPGQ